MRWPVCCSPLGEPGSSWQPRRATCRGPRPLESIRMSCYLLSRCHWPPVYCSASRPPSKAPTPIPRIRYARGTRGAGGGRHRAESIFVAVEIGLAVVLLAGAGLMIQSMWRLWKIDPGFDTRNLLTRASGDLSHRRRQRGRASGKPTIKWSIGWQRRRESLRLPLRHSSPSRER